MPAAKADLDSTHLDTLRLLRVLLLEDNPDDAALIENELEAAGYDVRVQVVDSRDGFVAHLHAGIDVILSDHALPSFNALQALDIVQEAGLDIPFLIVSGVIEEETAVEAMRRGAADYLLKDRLARLGPAVEHALNAKRLRVEKERAHEAIRQSEARYRLLAEHATDVIARIAPDGTCLFASPASRTLLGYAPNELVGRSSFDFVHPEDVAHLLQGLSAMQEQPFPETSTFRARRNDGSYVWIEANGTFVRDDASKDVREIVAVLRDVSERKKALDALAESEERWRRLVEDHPDPILISRDGRIVYLNPTGMRLLRAESADEVMNTPLTRFVDPDAHALVEAQLAAVAQRQPTAPAEFKVRNLEGEERMAEAYSVPIVYKGEACVQSVVRDVTARHEYEARLIEAKEQAEEMARLKSAFLTNMSHEICTPLTSIIGFADILADEASGEVQETARIIRSGGERLMMTLDSVLDLAQLESGSMNLMPVDLDLVEEIEKLLPAFERQAREKGLYLRFDRDAARVPVTMDMRALLRILTNLVANAVKFTNTGGVTVKIQPVGAHVRIHVVDTGIGIGQEFMSRLFGDFQQESDGLARAFEGVGLGLAITKRLVEMMGGVIEVASEKNVGTMFTVTLPAGGNVTAVSTAEATEDRWRPETPRVLAVEDQHDTRALLARLLHETYDLTLVSSAEEALATATAERFDLVLMDVNLGEGLSGTEILAALRQQPEYASVPVVACTAYALPGDQERFLASGFDAYIRKPFRAQSLLDSIDTALRKVEWARSSGGSLDART